jgi:hypothetical protein
VVFEFGSKNLWIHPVPALSQAKIWLELSATDTAAAAKHLARHGVVRRDEIEPLPAEMKVCWIKSPLGIIHLISQSE